MKTSCDIIRDLLPLYKDDVCSGKSRDLIEEHLEECEECRKYLAAMDTELNTSVSSSIQDINIFRKIDRRLNWLKTLTVLAVIVIILFVSTVIYVVRDYNSIHLFDRRIAAEDIRITELYELKDGNIYVTLESDSPCSVVSDRTIESPDGKIYTESYDNGQICLSLEKVSKLEHIFLNRLAEKKYSFVIPLQETFDTENPDPDQPFFDPDAAQNIDQSVIVHKSALVYYEGKDDERMTIWKKGQELAQAPESVEKMVRQTQDRENNQTDNSFDEKETSEYQDNILFW